MAQKRKYSSDELTVEFIRDRLDYNPNNGEFKIRKKSGKKGVVGNKTGSKGKNGYVYLYLNNNVALAHRVAWVYVYGEWPNEQVDHINRDRSDNRISNLRLASQSQNSCNGSLRSTNKSGYRGVSWSKEKKKWVSRIVKDRKQYVLGYFDDKEKAYMAYLEAANRLHGGFKGL